jgi:hypothetical protein
MNYTELHSQRQAYSGTDAEFVAWANETGPGTYVENWWNFNTIAAEFGDPATGMATAKAVADWLLVNEPHLYHKYLGTGFDTGAAVTRAMITQCATAAPAFAPLADWLLARAFVPSPKRCAAWGWAEVTEGDVAEATRRGQVETLRAAAVSAKESIISEVTAKWNERADKLDAILQTPTEQPPADLAGLDAYVKPNVP